MTAVKTMLRNLNPFEIVMCDSRTFDRICRIATHIDYGMLSQDNVHIFGLFVAWQQPNMIDDDFFGDAPKTFQGCWKILRFFFGRP